MEKFRHFLSRYNNLEPTDSYLSVGLTVQVMSASMPRVNGWFGLKKWFFIWSMSCLNWDLMQSMSTNSTLIRGITMVCSFHLSLLQTIVPVIMFAIIFSISSLIPATLLSSLKKNKMNNQFWRQVAFFLLKFLPDNYKMNWKINIFRDQWTFNDRVKSKIIPHMSCLEFLIIKTFECNIQIVQQR